MLKVYLAAPYGLKDTIAERAAELRAAGITVTSSWINEPHKPETQMGDLTPDEHAVYAIQDVKDVEEANVFVFHTDPTKTIVRAGRHVEFGMAVALKKTIFVVGLERENIFHHLPNVTHFLAWENVLRVLKTLEWAAQLRSTAVLLPFGTRTR